MWRKILPTIGDVNLRIWAMPVHFSGKIRHPFAMQPLVMNIQGMPYETEASLNCPFERSLNAYVSLANNQYLCLICDSIGMREYQKPVSLNWLFAQQAHQFRMRPKVRISFQSNNQQSKRALKVSTWAAAISKIRYRFHSKASRGEQETREPPDWPQVWSGSTISGELQVRWILYLGTRPVYPRHAGDKQPRGYYQLMAYSKPFTVRNQIATYN